MTGSNINLVEARAANEVAPSTLSRLARSTHKELRIRLADSPQTPEHILAELFEDPEPEVRLAVAENRRSPSRLLNLAAQDNHPDVRYGLAENHNLPVKLLRKLASDCNPFVAMRAETTLARLKKEGMVVCSS